MIRNAVVPVAGLGTRLLPATKSQPKEMLPVAKKPVVQYVVEELARSGAQQLLFITGRGKTSIENHFDRDQALVGHLRKVNRSDLLAEIDFEQSGLHFWYTRQSVQRGLGDAVLHGEAFAGHDPFLVALGDSIIKTRGKATICERMAAAYEEHGAAAAIAVEEVPREHVSLYGIIEPEADGSVFRVGTLIEKPRPEEAPSRLAVAGRYIFSPVIFDMLRRVEPDARGEIQLTDAIRMICESGRRVVAVKLQPGEKRYDIGSIPSYFETFIDFALADPDHGARVREYLTRLLRS